MVIDKLYQLLLVLGFYAISLLVCSILYFRAPASFEKIKLDNLEPKKQEEILALLYQSSIEGIKVYHPALVSCIFGIFVILALLASTNIPSYARFFLIFVGIIAIAFTVGVLAILLIFVGALFIVESSYKIGENGSTWFDHHSELTRKALIVPKWVPLIKNMMIGTTPRTLVGLLSFFWLVFLLPVFCVMLMLFLS